MRPTSREHKLELQRLRNKRFREKHQDKRKEQFKDWYRNNKDYFVNWRSLNRVSVNATAARWRSRNPEKVKANRLRIKTDDRYINARLSDSLRRRIHNSLKRNTGKRQSRTALVYKLLGCSIKDFRLYLESKFEPGMTFDNYGYQWHIDHIMPCAIFDLARPEHQRRCFHFSNMQPMWAKENISKKDKLTTNQFQLL